MVAYYRSFETNGLSHQSQFVPGSIPGNGTLKCEC